MLPLLRHHLQLQLPSPLLLSQLLPANEAEANDGDPTADAAFNPFGDADTFDVPSPSNATQAAYKLILHTCMLGLPVRSYFKRPFDGLFTCVYDANEEMCRDL